MPHPGRSKSRAFQTLHPVVVALCLAATLATPARSSPIQIHPDRLMQAPGQWSMLMNGPRRLGRTGNLGAQSSHELWRSAGAETNYGGPAIGADGTIYQGTLLGQFLAMRPNGSVKWSFVVPGTVE